MSLSKEEEEALEKALGAFDEVDEDLVEEEEDDEEAPEDAAAEDDAEAAEDADDAFSLHKASNSRSRTRNRDWRSSSCSETARSDDAFAVAPLSTLTRVAFVIFRARDAYMSDTSDWR